jgi:DNA-binding CsgD family transcriptional regulator
MMLATSGRLLNAVANGETFLASSHVVNDQVDPISVADGLDGLAVAYAELGQPVKAREAFGRSRVLASSAGHNIGLATTIMRELHRVAVPYGAEDVAYRRRLATEIETSLHSVAGISPSGISVRVGWVPVLYLEGRWADLLPEANRERRTASALYVARVARHEGRPGDAWAIAHEYFPDGPGARVPAISLNVAFWMRQLAVELALDEPNLTSAREWIVSFDRDLEHFGRVHGRSESQLMWARYSSLVGNTTAARKHAVAALSHASEPRQPLALISAHRMLGELATGAEDDAGAEQHLGESLALADACTVPFERALTLLALAELRAAEGRRDEARTLAKEVRAVCEPLNALPTLARVDDLLANVQPAVHRGDLPAGLTPREVEVLRLVAQGLTDAEVAERLFLARRTVNTHLTSIYTKLNVSSRAAATRFAVENGLT